MISGRLRTLALATVAVGAVVVVVFLVARREDVTPGPLASDEGNGLYFSAKVGRLFGYGVPIAYNRGEDPAIIERITLRDPSPGLRVVETHLGGPQRRILGYASGPWPDDDWDDLRPVKGFELMPADTPDGDRGVELIFVMRADRPGRYTTTGATIEYRVGSRRHRTTMRTVMAVCVAVKLKNQPRCTFAPIPEE